MDSTGCNLPVLKETCGASGPTLLKALVNPELWADAQMNEVLDYLASNRYAQFPEPYAKALQ